MRKIMIWVLALILLVGSAFGIVYLNGSNCSVNLNSASEYYVLTGDMSCPDTNGLNITNDNIILNCNNLIINGSGSNYGVFEAYSSKAIVNNCTISGFQYGIYVYHSDNSNFTNNVVYGNAKAGLMCLMHPALSLLLQNCQQT